MSGRDELIETIRSALDGRCGHCFAMRATQADWDKYGDGEGEHLCWSEYDGDCFWGVRENRDALVADAILEGWAK